MGNKGKAEANGLVELIVEKWDGGKNTIVYVTEEVNRTLQEKGMQVTFSRESIRRVIKSPKKEIEDAKKAIEAARAMAEVLKDNPGTEIAEATIMHLSGLIAKDIRSVESLAESQMKLSQYRTKAVNALEKAKEHLKAELQKEIQNDPELMEKLCLIIDKAEVK